MLSQEQEAPHYAGHPGVPHYAGHPTLMPLVSTHLAALFCTYSNSSLDQLDSLVTAEVAALAESGPSAEELLRYKKVRD